MTTLFKKGIKAIKTLYDNPLIVNAYVTSVDGQVMPTNWGDDINYHFLTHLTKREVAIYFDTPVAIALKKTNYLCIGSTLNYLPTRQTVVWGAGVIDDKLELREKPARVHAVRGPLTRKHLLSLGIPCPVVYGDPALLIPYFYKPAPSKKPRKYRIGVVPHYADWTTPGLAKLKADHPDIDIIDITNYGIWTDFIDRICDCDVLLSSSLHGLIVAEAFGIANYWISLSDKVIGQGFKFRDYYASIGKQITAPLILNETSDLMALISSQPWTQGRLNLTQLLDSCPFEIKEPLRHEHPMDL